MTSFYVSVIFKAVVTPNRYKQIEPNNVKPNLWKAIVCYNFITRNFFMLSNFLLYYREDILLQFWNTITFIRLLPVLYFRQYRIFPALTSKASIRINYNIRNSKSETISYFRIILQEKSLAFRNGRCYILFLDLPCISWKRHSHSTCDQFPRIGSSW